MFNTYTKNFIQQFIEFFVPVGRSKLIVTPKNLQKVVLFKNKTYDYIILVGVLEESKDIQLLLEQLYLLLTINGRLIIIYRNFLHPFLTSFISDLFTQKKHTQNWLSTHDIKTFLKLSDFESILSQPFCFLSNDLPIISKLFNKFLLFFFPFNHLAFLQYIVARKSPQAPQDASVSIIIPARNETGNIEKVCKSLPLLGTSCEVIFVEGHSTDNTQEEIRRCIKKYSSLLPFKFSLLTQNHTYGKAAAVTQGFAKAQGEILMIYDADMSVAPYDLTKFYIALITGKGEFINGSRLIYPMQGQAMQLLNILGNKLFSILYSWILGQKIKDSLCGTKVLWKKDYMQMKLNLISEKARDPFGDFELLLGASRMNLQIFDLPIRYHERVYGTTNIKRFKNALELLKYSFIAIKTLKMRISS